MARRSKAWWFLSALLTIPLSLADGVQGARSANEFTPLVELPRPAIVGQAEEYPGGAFKAEHMLDARVQSEYASHGKGLETFIDFDFGRPVRVAGFRHVDRQDPATVDAAELTFSDQADFAHVLATETIDHVNRPGGTTCAVFATPTVARYVRWKVTQLNAQGHACAGGRDIRFLTCEPPEPSLQRDRIGLQVVQAIVRSDAGPLQPLLVTVDHVYAEPVEATVKVGDRAPTALPLAFGSQAVKVLVPPVAQETAVPIEISVAGETILKQDVTLAPPRHWELHFLPHSHVDIGYTHVQTEVEQKQWQYLRDAIDIAQRTADYPPGARFKWNSEVLWAVDGYLKQAGEEERAEFLQAVRDGTLHLDGLYGNELTALCRPEELMQLVGCARQISRQYDVAIDSAMISDVPGYTWGIVPALVQSGIKYLSIGPNHVHRIGSTLDRWGDRPFYWVSPSGQDRLLCWMAGKAYSWFHGSRVGTLSRDSAPEPFLEYLAELMEQEYPYDLVQIRYSIGGDNGPPDQELSEFVRKWNETYIWPRMVISTTSELMHALEDRYGDQLPEVRGDFTPYWEDGAASSARETAQARVAAEWLVQAETLWAIRSRDTFPIDEFESAWRDVILYNEHTWGAHCSITQPDSPFTLSQWQIKQAFAVEAQQKSRALLDRASGMAALPQDAGPVQAVDVLNTTSWPRTDLVVLHTDVPLQGHVVKDLDGNVVPSEITRRGHLAFLAANVPPLGAKRFVVETGEPEEAGQAMAEGNTVWNQHLRVEIDPQSGAIASVRRTGSEVDLVDRSTLDGWNAYRYVAGRVADDPQPGAVSRVEVMSSGGLSASLLVYSDAPGCEQLITIVRLIDDMDRVDIINLVDKQKVLHAESVHFGFPFHIPDGVMRIDLPWAVVRPEIDQLPGACKNYLTVGRWVDVSNEQVGVTWSTIDAPLIEVGRITVDVSDPFNGGKWIQQLEPTQTLYSYVMNNYWETNYKASQDGMTMFRYSILPHGPYDQSAASRFGIERSQPLVVVPSRLDAPLMTSRLQVEGDHVIVTSLKPSADGQALMLRLFNAGAEPTRTAIRWSEPVPRRVAVSSPREEVGTAAEGPISLPPLGIVTLRAEF